jgi:hypothetical protein
MPDEVLACVHADLEGSAMTRHLADHSATTTDSRTKRYTQIELAQQPEGSHPSAKALHKRPATREEATRMRAYMRIEKGALT